MVVMKTFAQNGDMQHRFFVLSLSSLTVTGQTCAADGIC
jgi:hypothetical protein